MDATHKSKTNSGIGAIGSYGVSVMLFAVGAATLALTALMNVSLSDSVALTDSGKLIRKSASILMDCSGPILFLVAGLLIRRKMRMAGAIVFLFGVAFQAYTSINLVGFSASERMGAQAHSERLATAKNQVAATVLDAKKTNLDWLRRSTVDAKGAQKMAMIGEVNAAADRLADTPVDTTPALKPDAHAALLAKLFGISVDRVQTIDAILIAVLLGALKMICFTLAPVFWPRGASGAVEMAPALPGPKDSARLPRTTRALPQMTPATSDMRPALLTAVSADSNVLPMRDRKAVLVQRFLREMTASVHGAQTTAEDLHRAYNDWARANNVRTFKQNMLGRICGRDGLQLPRKSDGKCQQYLNIQLTAAPARKAA